MWGWWDSWERLELRLTIRNKSAILFYHFWYHLNFSHKSKSPFSAVFYILSTLKLSSASNLLTYSPDEYFYWSILTRLYFEIFDFLSARSKLARVLFSLVHSPCRSISSWLTRQPGFIFRSLRLECCSRACNSTAPGLARSPPRDRVKRRKSYYTGQVTCQPVFNGAAE